MLQTAVSSTALGHVGRLLHPCSVVARFGIEFRETVRAFSDELVALQQPIRSHSVVWGDELRVIFDMKTSVAQYYLGRGHQIAIRTNLDRLEKWNGPARRFRACALLTALTIVFDASESLGRSRHRSTRP